MPFFAVLLRCVLALALVAGGLPSPAMAGPHDHADVVEVQASAMPGCHDSEAADAKPEAAGVTDTDCCGVADCQCDCLQHMPLVVLVLPAMEIQVLPAPTPAASLPGRHGLMASNSLRPPIA
jgi:hypothetical protein